MYTAPASDGTTWIISRTFGRTRNPKTVLESTH